MTLQIYQEKVYLYSHLKILFIVGGLSLRYVLKILVEEEWEWKWGNSQNNPSHFEKGNTALPCVGQKNIHTEGAFYSPLFLRVPFRIKSYSPW